MSASVRLPVLAAVLALLVTGCGGGRAAGVVSDPQAAVLHAGDMPRGYREGDDTVCGVPSATEGNWPQLETLFWETQPEGCSIDLYRAWAPPGGVTSVALVFGNVEDAERGYRAQAELFRFTVGLDADRVERANLGDEAQLVHGGAPNGPAVAAVWRTGNVVALLTVEPADDELALELAGRQQKLIQGDATPAPPINPADELELPLDDPALTMPVYWLGRTFGPEGGLPPVALDEVYASSTGAQLGYSARASGRYAGLRMVQMPAATWERERRTRLGRAVWDSPCARKTVVELPNGHAEIYEGYGVLRRLTEPCPKTEPDRVVALVYLDDVVVTVNMPYCYTCGLVSSGNPYETIAAMTKVVRGLNVRERHS